MTEISFHFNAPDRSGYACRIVRKAVRQGRSVVVSAPLETLERFERELWAFDAYEFIAHGWLDRAGGVPARLHASTVWLATDASGATSQDTLINLGDAAPVGFASFARMVEVVSASETDRSLARERWKHYANRGYPIARHEVAS